MAVQLPTFSVSDPVAQRLLAAFGTAEEFRNWLKGAIRAEVARRELSAVEQDNRARVAATQGSLAAAVGTELDPTPPPVQP